MANVKKVLWSLRAGAADGFWAVKTLFGILQIATGGSGYGPAQEAGNRVWRISILRIAPETGANPVSVANRSRVCQTTFGCPGQPCATPGAWPTSGAQIYPADGPLLRARSLLLSADSTVPLPVSGRGTVFVVGI